MFTSKRHQTLFEAWRTQSITSHSVRLTSFLIFNSNLWQIFQVLSFCQVFTPKPYTIFYFVTCTPIYRTSQPSSFHKIKITWQGIKFMWFINKYFSQSFCYFSLNIFLRILLLIAIIIIIVADVKEYICILERANYSEKYLNCICV
jgi:hypothetical protein